MKNWCGKATTIKEIKIDGSVYSEPKRIAEELNKHFSTLGARLESEIPQSINKPVDYLEPTNSNFHLAPISSENVLRLLSKLCTSKATGLDKISAKLLKTAAPAISSSLTHIFNTMIIKGIFPDDLKKARVIPIFKDDKRNNPNNYRPISVLPVVARIFEKIVFDQLYNYLSRNDLLTKTQSGFRPLHSTLTTLLKSTDIWLSNIDEKLLNGVLFLDLKKAFDTVEHEILLFKLAYYGVSENSLAFFNSYLQSRVQHCCVNGVLSGPQNVTHGVPQGSVLGPLHFLIYVNDLPNCLDSAVPSMYADDTNVTVSSNNVSNLEGQLNHELDNINEWLKANRLSINQTKTEFMIISSRHCLLNIEREPTVSLGDVPLSRVQTKKCLGLIIDEHLGWSPHIDLVIKKACNGLKALRRCRSFVPRETLLGIYNSLVRPYFDYCASVWGKCDKGLRDKIQILQNQGAKILTRASYDSSSTEALKLAGWSPLEQNRLIQEALMMFKIYNQLAPDYLSDMFIRSNERHNYSLRNSDTNFILPFPHTEAGKRRFSYHGAHLWNSLPSDIKAAPSIDSFKDRINKYFSIN